MSLLVESHARQLAVMATIRRHSASPFRRRKGGLGASKSTGPVRSAAPLEDSMSLLREFDVAMSKSATASAAVAQESDAAGFAAPTSGGGPTLGDTLLEAQTMASTRVVEPKESAASILLRRSIVAFGTTCPPRLPSEYHQRAKARARLALTRTVNSSESSSAEDIAISALNHDAASDDSNVKQPLQIAAEASADGGARDCTSSSIAEEQAPLESIAINTSGEPADVSFAEQEDVRRASSISKILSAERAALLAMPATSSSTSSAAAVEAYAQAPSLDPAASHAIAHRKDFLHEELFGDLAFAPWQATADTAASTTSEAKASATTALDELFASVSESLAPHATLDVLRGVMQAVSHTQAPGSTISGCGALEPAVWLQSPVLVSLAAESVADANEVDVIGRRLGSRLNTAVLAPRDVILISLVTLKKWLDETLLEAAVAGVAPSEIVQSLAATLSSDAHVFAGLTADPTARAVADDISGGVLQSPVGEMQCVLGLGVVTVMAACGLQRGLGMAAPVSSTSATNPAAVTDGSTTISSEESRQSLAPSTSSTPSQQPGGLRCSSVLVSRVLESIDKSDMVLRAQDVLSLLTGFADKVEQSKAAAIAAAAAADAAEAAKASAVAVAGDAVKAETRAAAAAATPQSATSTAAVRGGSAAQRVVAAAPARSGTAASPAPSPRSSGSADKKRTGGGAADPAALVTAELQLSKAQLDGAVDAPAGAYTSAVSLLSTTSFFWKTLHCVIRTVRGIVDKCRDDVHSRSPLTPSNERPFAANGVLLINLPATGEQLIAVEHAVQGPILFRPTTSAGSHGPSDGANAKIGPSEGTSSGSQRPSEGASQGPSECASQGSSESASQGPREDAVRVSTAAAFSMTAPSGWDGALESAISAYTTGAWSIPLVGKAGVEALRALRERLAQAESAATNALIDASAPSRPATGTGKKAPASSAAVIASLTVAAAAATAASDAVKLLPNPPSSSCLDVVLSITAAGRVGAPAPAAAGPPAAAVEAVAAAENSHSHEYVDAFAGSIVVPSAMTALNLVNAGIDNPVVESPPPVAVVGAKKPPSAASKGAKGAPAAALTPPSSSADVLAPKLSLCTASMRVVVDPAAILKNDGVTTAEAPAGAEASGKTAAHTKPTSASPTKFSPAAVAAGTTIAAVAAAPSEPAGRQLQQWLQRSAAKGTVRVSSQFREDPAMTTQKVAGVAELGILNLCGEDKCSSSSRSEECAVRSILLSAARGLLSDVQASSADQLAFASYWESQLANDSAHSLRRLQLESMSAVAQSSDVLAAVHRTLSQGVALSRSAAYREEATASGTVSELIHRGLTSVPLQRLSSELYAHATADKSKLKRAIATASAIGGGGFKDNEGKLQYLSGMAAEGAFALWTHIDRIAVEARKHSRRADGGQQLQHFLHVADDALRAGLRADLSVAALRAASVYDHCAAHFSASARAEIDLWETLAVLTSTASAAPSSQNDSSSCDSAAADFNKTDKNSSATVTTADPSTTTENPASAHNGNSSSSSSSSSPVTTPVPPTRVSASGTVPPSSTSASPPQVTPRDAVQSTPEAVTPGAAEFTTSAAEAAAAVIITPSIPPPITLTSTEQEPNTAPANAAANTASGESESVPPLAIQPPSPLMSRILSSRTSGTGAISAFLQSDSVRSAIQGFDGALTELVSRSNAARARLVGGSVESFTTAVNSMLKNVAEHAAARIDAIDSSVASTTSRIGGCGESITRDVQSWLNDRSAAIDGLNASIAAEIDRLIDHDGVEGGASSATTTTTQGRSAESTVAVIHAFPRRSFGVTRKPDVQVAGAAVSFCLPSWPPV